MRWCFDEEDASVTVDCARSNGEPGKAIRAAQGSAGWPVRGLGGALGVWAADPAAPGLGAVLRAAES